MENVRENIEQADHTPELTVENIEEQITTELKKVVGIDQHVLGKYVKFLETMGAEPVASMLHSLKEKLGEQLLPFLEQMGHDEQEGIAEIGIQKLGAIPSLKAAQILSEINDHHPNKNLRKAARTSLYKLKSIGIDVETSHKPMIGLLKHEPYKTLISPIDGTGSQLIMLSEEMLAGDLHFLQVITSETKGITECSSRRGITKKMFAKLPENFARETGATNPMLVEADYAYAMSLILEAEAMNASSGEELPDDYSSMKAFFGLHQAQRIENPIYRSLDAENLKNQPYFLRTSEELFKNDAFLTWLLPLNEMGEFTQQLLDQEDTTIELTPQFKQERKEEVYQKIVEKHFPEDAVKHLQRRLQIMSYILLLQKDEENAKRAFAASLAFEGMPVTSLKQHPFLRRLILDSVEVTQQVVEDGYDPSEMEREHYTIRRDEKGELVVKFVEE